MKITTTAPAAAVTLLGALFVLAAACGSSGGGGSPTAASTSASPRLSGTPGAGGTDSQITLGMTNDLAGVGDTPNAAITTAAQAYFAKLNAEDGGVCGRQVKLLAEDDQASPEMALVATKKLVEQDHVLAMIGGIGFDQHKMVAPYLNDPNGDGNTADGVPDLFVSTGWSGWADVQHLPWTVSLAADWASDGAVLGRYINIALASKSVAILYQNDDFGRDYIAGLKGALKRPLLAEHGYDPAQADISGQMNAIHEANPDILVLATSPSFTTMALKTAQALDFHPQVLMGYTNSPSKLASDLGGGIQPEQLQAGFKLLDGVRTTGYLQNTIQDESAPAIKEHERIMEQFNGPAASALSLYGQALAEVTAAGLKASCDDLTPRGLLRGAESIHGFTPSVFDDGIAINLGATDHRGVQALQPLRILADGSLVSTGTPLSVE